LIDSSICRESLAALCAMLVMVPTAQALNPSRLLDQYIHDRWSVDLGLPAGPVNAVAQTPDGYLWIGSEQGLVRFDGVSFRVFNHANTESLPGGRVIGLVTDKEGSLWIHLDTRDVLCYRHNRFEPVSSQERVTAMGRGLGGDILLAGSGRVMRYATGKSGTIGSPPIPLVIAIAESSDGTIWLGTHNGLFGLRNGSSFDARGLPDRKVNCLLAGDAGSLWVGTDHGLVRWTGHEITQEGLAPQLRSSQILTMMRDRDRNLWLGTARGTVRMTAAGTYSDAWAAARPSDPAIALFEDREGSLWIGSEQGIQRYRDRVFLAIPIDGGAGPVFTDAMSRTWFGPPSGGLFWIRGKERQAVTVAGLGADVVYSISGGGGEIWVGRQRGGLTRLRTDGGDFEARTFTAATGLAAGSVTTVHRNRDGTVWAGTLNGGVSRVRDGQVKTYTTTDGLASNAISAIEEGADGAVWFATASGLNAFAQDRWRTPASSEGAPPARINCLMQDSANVLWIGTEPGLAFLSNGRLHTPRDLPEPLADEILGLSDDGRGFLWIATGKHVVRVPRNRLLDEHVSADDVREFGSGDGILATKGIRRDRSVMRDSAGRIWFSLRSGISMVEPERLAADSVPAIVHVESVSADGMTVPGGALFRIPAGRRRIRFEYLAITLSVPERVRYRYRLDGFDADWAEPATTRETVYTNLNPGPYTFRVIASNSDGIWNSTEARIHLDVTPEVWQRLWFKLAVVAACLLAMATIYRFRLHNVTKQLSIRFEERLDERTRIAQELHDTLLQGLIATSMQLSVTVDGLPQDAPTRPQFARVLAMLRQVVSESRNAVRGLRSPDSGVDDLEQALSRVREEVAATDSTVFRIVVDGARRPLNPFIRDAAYRIGREALINAFRHSKAAEIELAFYYEAKEFRLVVRDTGVGIDEQFVEKGRDGHWGLIGMRESAEKIGAQLRVRSRASAGTEVELRIPASGTYSETAKKRSWLGPFKMPRA
jgi:signal transduction histidine kinase/ligand-binding sensor domain-containing protein